MKNYDELKYIDSISKIIGEMDKEIESNKKKIRINQILLAISLIINIILIVGVFL